MNLDLFQRRRVGAGLWGLGFLVAAVFAFGRTAPVGVGYGYAPAVNLGPLETARVLALPVGLNEPVTSGEVVVRMDPAPLVAERDVAEAALKAVTVDQQRISTGEARKFSQGVQSNLVDQAKLAAQVQEDLASLATLQDRLRVEQDLESRGASSPQAVEEWRRQISVVQARVDANRTAASVAGGAVQDARQRQQDLPAANQWEVEEATRQLNLVEDRIRRYDLSSTLDGQVSWVYHQVGDVVAAGDPVLQVRAAGTRQVVAFVSSSSAPLVAVGGPATVRRSSGQTVAGRVVSIGNGMEPVPPAIWKMPGWPEYGIAVRIDLDSEIGPDEPVTAKF